MKPKSDSHLKLAGNIGKVSEFPRSFLEVINAAPDRHIPEVRLELTVEFDRVFRDVGFDVHRFRRGPKNERSIIVNESFRLGMDGMVKVQQSQEAENKDVFFHEFFLEISAFVPSQVYTRIFSGFINLFSNIFDLIGLHRTGRDWVVPNGTGYFFPFSEVAQRLAACRGMGAFDAPDSRAPSKL